MDAGRYLLQQPGWDNSSALEGYDSILDPDLRRVGVYGGRGFSEPGFQRESGFPRAVYPRDLLFERDAFSLRPPVLGLWPSAQRRSLEEEIAIIREAQRQGHEKRSLVESFRDDYQEYGFDNVGGQHPNWDRDSLEDDDEYDYRHRILQPSREGSREEEYEYSRHRDYEFDRERSRREKDVRRRRERDRSRRSRSRERDWSPDRDRRRDRSRSFSHDDRMHRSRSPRARSRAQREDSHEELRRDTSSEKKRDRDGNRQRERASLPPSATLVVKGLSQKTLEDDLYQALAEWGPLKHVRVIKEKNSGISRGFAFIDFPSVEGAQKMMEGIGNEGLVVNGRRVFFEYSSKPTGGSSAPQAAQGHVTRGAGSANVKGGAVAAADWMCTVCGCVNFARRTVCFQCNEGRAEDAPAADTPLSSAAPAGKKISEPGMCLFCARPNEKFRNDMDLQLMLSVKIAGPTHVLVVRGLDENVDEESLHFEFSKHAAIKDLRLVRDKFTHVSRGFAFVHFHSVEDATKALEASSGTTLEKNGQVLRVAFAKSIHGPHSSSAGSGPSQSSSLAAAAIEAATFAQQYDSSGWAPKEYNPEQAQGVGAGSGAGSAEGGGAPQSGFVWDERSGYYYDAASGFYYDGHRGLYYDGNNGIWYTYNQETQEYKPFVDSDDGAKQSASAKSVKGAGDSANEKASGSTIHSKAVISAPACTITAENDAIEKKPTLAEAVAAAAVAAQAAQKREKERMKEKQKEMRLAGKNPGMGSKKISNVVTLWKQRKNEGQVSSVTADDVSTFPASSIDAQTDGIPNMSMGPVATMNSKFKFDDTTSSKESAGYSSNSLGRGSGNPFGGNYHPSEISGRIRQSSITTVTGMGRGAGRGAVRGMDTGAVLGSSAAPELSATTPFKTDASALGSYGPMAGAGTKRRFTESPQSVYRDRAAERRSLYGSSLSNEMLLDPDLKDKGVGSSRAGTVRGLDMPFPPGVGSKTAGPVSVLGGPETQAFDVITTEKALDENNVGNRMLRSMGWQEGSGLGKEGTGIVEPVQPQTLGERAGLGSQVQRRVDARFETHPGDTYRVVIQKKALARFHEMM
ncbi:hypothetical protein O6H91_22G061300 [Diphasiastrum complanatum]|uniref:Uncharacterized protein n=1 Tax=Diphasiastrum complanatum TaxID=34168 RepID=A0ACC2AG22_DIPCM|nr:hypothetical protein O6H91_Y122500 [Diphasiastrum complanatum]KAJ7516520.1 hypothetical protein O6H91_22G061300 [Diphasiastrum complanatum]